MGKEASLCIDHITAGLRERKRNASGAGESPKHHQIEPLPSNHGAERAHGGRGEERIARARDVGTSTDVDPIDGAGTLRREERASHGRELHGEVDRGSDLGPVLAGDAGRVDRPRQLAAQQCIAHGSADIDGNAPLRFDGRSPMCGVRNTFGAARSGCSAASGSAE